MKFETEIATIMADIETDAMSSEAGLNRLLMCLQEVHLHTQNLVTAKKLWRNDISCHSHVD